jgi:hypothetical protein
MECQTILGVLLGIISLTINSPIERIHGQVFLSEKKPVLYIVFFLPEIHEDIKIGPINY